MTPPINIDGSEVTGITIDGTEVSEVTVDGQTVFTPSVIPDSGLLHNWDFGDSSTTTSFVADLKGASDLDTGTFSSLTTINSRQAGRFDGVDDELFTTTPEINKDDAYVFVVAKFAGSLPTSGDAKHVFGKEDANGFDFGVDGSSWNLNPFGANVSGGTADTNPHIFEVDAENTDQVELYVDGSVVLTADDNGGNTTFGGIYIGRSDNLSSFDYGEFDVGQVLIYDEPQVDKTKVRQVLSEFWNINIA
jgi:hypothetical protein